jgi:transcriptional regulator with XRE-family HTH domain
MATNLAALMASRGWKARDLAARCNVSFRQIHNILNGTSVPSVETVDELASAFGLRGWHLLISELPAELLASNAVERLVDDFSAADAEGRDLAFRVIKRAS